MIGINVTYTTKPGKGEEFLGDIAACGVAGVVREEDGCIQYDYFRSVHDPDKVLLVEKWTDREAQTVHLTQPHMTQLKILKERYVLGTIVDFYDL